MPRIRPHLPQPQPPRLLHQLHPLLPRPLPPCQAGHQDNVRADLVPHAGRRAAVVYDSRQNTLVDEDCGVGAHGVAGVAEEGEAAGGGVVVQDVAEVVE